MDILIIDNINLIFPFFPNLILYKNIQPIMQSY